MKLSAKQAALDQVDEFGGEEFVLFVLCFLEELPRLLTPLCSLLHIMCFGAHKDMIVDGMMRHLAKVPFEKRLFCCC